MNDKLIESDCGRFFQRSRHLFALASFAVILAIGTLAVAVLGDGPSNALVGMLFGAPINNIIPVGHVSFTSTAKGSELVVTVEKVNLASGTVLDVLVDGTKVGTIKLGTLLAAARLDLNSEKGDKVPPVTSRSRIVVANGTATILAGGFIAAFPPPSPSPSGSPRPSPSPTVKPSPIVITRLVARLAGAAISGLTPTGQAMFSSQGTNRALFVSVEKVNLAANTVLNVNVDNAKIGTITLNARLEGGLILDTHMGKAVPNIVSGSAITITNAQNQTILAGTFSTVPKPPTTANDVDDPDFFVEQQFRDFLGREADDDGLAYWTNNITQCGSDPTCIEAMRVNTSAAFFLSIEFQETGGTLYRLNKASYGTMPRRDSFLVDAETATQGLIVGEPGWQQTLADNKQRVADNWVQRPEFLSRFGSLSNEQYVDALFSNSGVQPSQLERSQLIQGLQQNQETRAQVLLQVADGSALRQKEQNAEFVLMQYFGYLHRNPDEGMDHDMSGFNYWLNKLNSFGGDYNKAEMVRAFIDSAEYRDRFQW